MQRVEHEVGGLVGAASTAWALRGPADGPRPIAVGGFVLEREVVVPAPPGEAFDAFTGDVSGWWDHTFSEAPHALVLEPRAGGSFLELYDEDGHGVQHARVTVAIPGETLRFTGSLPFSGTGFEMVHDVRFEAVEEGTRVVVRVTGVGEVLPGADLAVYGVWGHFLDEQFLPYVTEGRHRTGD